MPEIDWTPSHKRTSTVQFDRLKLKSGETARIVCMEKPHFSWVHTMKAPKIVDGGATKIVRKRRDGTEFDDWDMEFVGRPLCIGDPGIIGDNGVDPANCPVCERATKSEEVSAPERRFSTNIIRYNTRSDGALVNPFGCTSLVWSFTENVFNKLLNIAEEYTTLVGRDLILGPCGIPEAYQKFDIAVGAKNHWEQYKDIVNQTHEENRVADLEQASGRKVELVWLKKDLDKIAAQWRIAHGVKETADGTQNTNLTSLKGELDNLLTPPPNPNTTTRLPQGDQPPWSIEPDAPKADVAKPADDFNKLLSGLNI